MRRKENEITDKNEIERILKESRVCRLAMVSGDKPYVVPMNYGYSDGTLYLHSARQGQKIEILKKNPHVCFEVDQVMQLKKAKLACDWGIEYKSVIGRGEAVMVDTPLEKKQALKVIMAHYSDREFDFSDEMLDQTQVIKVVVDQITGKQS